MFRRLPGTDPCKNLARKEIIRLMAHAEPKTERGRGGQADLFENNGGRQKDAQGGFTEFVGENILV